jgi:hypothetical protein
MSCSPILAQENVQPSTGFEGIMLYRIARFLQLLGLLILPVGVAGNVARPDLVGVRGSLTIAILGMMVFGMGWLIQQKFKAP